MSENKKEVLFNEFPPVKTKTWEDTIKKDLKGGDYNKKLIWKTLEGFDVKPYYRSEDIKNHSGSLPGEYPFLCGTKFENNWEIRQDIIIDSIAEANKKAIDSIQKGADSISFNTKNISFATQKEFSQLLKGILLEKIPVHFISGKEIQKIFFYLSEEVRIQKLDKNKIAGSLTTDPIGFLTTKGEFYESENADFLHLKTTLESALKNLPNVKIISVSGYQFHNAGSSIVQELGYALAVGNDYIDKLSEAQIPLENILKNLHFNFAVGSNYFLEIAKFRAARLLWAKIVNEYNPASTTFSKMQINAVTTSWNKTIYDPFVNVLRTTTETMSAAIAGVDSISVKPYDMCYKKSDNFSERVARNQQIILKEEAFLSNIVDASAGSYYIETLTESVAEEAWKIFLMCEKNGGYTNAFKAGIIQKEIEQIALQRDLNIATKKDILLGTNQYPNLHETAHENLTNSCNLKNHNHSKKTTVTPLKLYRGAQTFEDIRLHIEKLKNNKPKVFLFPFGNSTMRKARAGFATNIFASAGFDIINNSGFKNIEDGINECHKQKPAITILCSSDDEYEENVPLIFEKLKDKTILIIAGNPKNLADKIKAIKLNHYIFTGMNILECLQDLIKEIRQK